jgi:hypothetical protein
VLATFQQLLMRRGTPQLRPNCEVQLPGLGSSMRLGRRTTANCYVILQAGAAHRSSVAPGGELALPAHKQYPNPFFPGLCAAAAHCDTVPLAATDEFVGPPIWLPAGLEIPYHSRCRLEQIPGRRLR